MRYSSSGDTTVMRAMDAGMAPSDLAWRVIGLVNLYRLLVAGGLFVASQFDVMRAVLGVERPQEMVLICALYFFAGVALIALRRLPMAGLRLLALTHALVDSVAIGFILWAAGGVVSGLGILLLLPIGAMALLASNRDAYFMAAVATLSILAQQFLVQLRHGAGENQYLLAGVLGAVIFITALSVRPLARRLVESEALVRRRDLDLANLAQLSQYIVQHLRESMVVVDEEDRIRLINESAAEMLGDAHAWPGALLGECAPRLLFLLAAWRQHGEAQEAGAIATADGSRLVRPHFAGLGSTRPCPVLIFLEDTSVMEEKVQQFKLAALGRLSASIAHEIRTPVGAMSHAGQLLAESTSIQQGDRRLTKIIQDNAARISRIIDNVLELSRRGASKPERLDLLTFIRDFQTEFCATQQVATELVKIVAPAAGAAAPAALLEIRVDPSQMQQVLWNLCQNALTHGRTTADTASPVEIRYGRLATNGRPYLEVVDQGPGIPMADSERIFEPFFTRAPRGTGLGLFLARELAQANHATLLHEPAPRGGTVFRLVFSDPARWEA
jgi:two-component system sensor histidine kinase PilS (NtrC family)